MLFLKNNVLDKIEVEYSDLKIWIFNYALPQFSVDIFYIHDLIYLIKPEFCHIAILTPNSPIFI